MEPGAGTEDQGPGPGAVGRRKVISISASLIPSREVSDYDFDLMNQLKISFLYYLYFCVDQLKEI